MFSILLALCTYYLSMKLNSFRDSPYFVRFSIACYLPTRLHRLSSPIPHFLAPTNATRDRRFWRRHRGYRLLDSLVACRSRGAESSIPP